MYQYLTCSAKSGAAAQPSCINSQVVSQKYSIVADAYMIDLFTIWSCDFKRHTIPHFDQ